MENTVSEPFRLVFQDQVAEVERALAANLGRVPELLKAPVENALGLAPKTDGFPRSKRLRGVLFLLVHESNSCERALCSDVSAALEMVHAASLVADDLQDRHNRRWGRRALWVEIGPERALNVVVALIALATDIVARKGAEFDFQPFLGRTIISMVEGQEIDLALAGGNVEIKEGGSISRYFQSVDGKTCALLRTAVQLGAHSMESSIRESLDDYAASLGRAHQIQDDLDDFEAGVDLPSNNVLTALGSELDAEAAHCKAVELAEEYVGAAVRSVASIPLGDRVIGNLVWLAQIILRPVDATLEPAPVAEERGSAPSDKRQGMV